MPGKVGFRRAEDDAVEKCEGFVIAGFEPFDLGAPLGEDFPCHTDSMGIGYGPESFVEHPVCVAGKGESVFRAVVPRLRKPMNVSGLDER